MKHTRTKYVKCPEWVVSRAEMAVARENNLHWSLFGETREKMRNLAPCASDHTRFHTGDNRWVNRERERAQEKRSCHSDIKPFSSINISSIRIWIHEEEIYVQTNVGTSIWSSDARHLRSTDFLAEICHWWCLLIFHTKCFITHTRIQREIGSVEQLVREILLSHLERTRS